jgi:hypothetical protein
MNRCIGFFLSAVIALLSYASARANTEFVDLPSPTGKFEWNVFMTPYAGPHAPDVGSAGVGSASLTVNNPSPTGGLVTGGNDLYSGFSPTTAKHVFSLSGAATANAITTLALQLAISPAGNAVIPGSFLLWGTTAPTQFVHRGVAPGGSRYYWALWETPAAASYSVEFSAPDSLSLRGAQLDYVNSTSSLNVAAPSQLPEPASAAIAASACGALALFARRRRAAA